MKYPVILTTTKSFSNAVARSELKDEIERCGVTVVTHEKLSPPFPFDPADVRGIVAGALVPFGTEEAKYFPNVKIVMPFGVGTDHVDESALARRGILFKVIPGVNRHSVAELTIGFLFALSRGIVRDTESLRRGVWNRTMGSEVAGKTLGIVGLGNIGKEVARIARALGLRVVANDIVYDEAFLQDCGVEKTDFDTVLKNSDFISFHVPLTSATRAMVNKKTLVRIKKGAFLINTSRGEVVDEDALFDALESGQIAGAALDVFAAEPPFDNPSSKNLIAHPRVIATPHNATFTPETQYRVARATWDAMRNVFS